MAVTWLPATVKIPILHYKHITATVHGIQIYRILILSIFINSLARTFRNSDMLSDFSILSVSMILRLHDTSTLAAMKE